ncbi:GNAT family N-acetyltransferase [Streptomyces cyaneofuscatus]
MQVHVRPYEARDLDPIVDLSLRAWVPVYESFVGVLGPEVFQRQYPDWRTSQRDEVAAACTDGKAHVWVAESGAKVVGFVAVVLEPEGGAGAVELLAVDPACQGQEVGRRRPDTRRCPWSATTRPCRHRSRPRAGRFRCTGVVRRCSLRRSRAPGSTAQEPAPPTRPSTWTAALR